jgi:hypothetical protein
MLNLSLNLKPDIEKKIKQILAQLSDQDIFFQDIINQRGLICKNLKRNTTFHPKSFTESLAMASWGTMKISWSGPESMKCSSRTGKP